ncbi:MAG: DUF126 domain-containing protein [Methanobacteriota archaeon]|nr:MAG: DUF126 domain-containing protein [Euryarchaeota archaeon]
MGDMVIEGEAIVTSQPITLLGFVDATTGKIVEEDHELFGQSITGKIFVFPKGVGSTVGPYVLLNLKKNGKAPLAIINRESDQGTISGCSVAKIPMIYRLDRDPVTSIRTGDRVKIVVAHGSAIVEVM